MGILYLFCCIIALVGSTINTPQEYKENTMFPQPIYDALPYLYIGSGLVAVISIANILALISGSILVITAIYVFWMRGYLHLS